MYPGIDGFLGTRASIMLDLVFLAMFAVLPVLAWSIWQVRVHRRFQLHQRVQWTLAAILLAAVTLFEIDMRFVSGWRERAEASPYFAPVYSADPISQQIFCGLLGCDDVPGWVFRALAIHLVFATSTTALWVFVIATASRRFGNPPVPGAHSASHRRFGWLAAADMALTALTGWIFYWLAFVA
jgi:hypothetical protein